MGAIVPLQGDPFPSPANLTNVNIFHLKGGEKTSLARPVIGETLRLHDYSLPGYLLSKLDTRPGWIREVYGYKERFSESEQVSERVFDVPTSGRKRAIDWWLGYSYSKPSVRSTDRVKNYIDIGRVLPEQHPKYPWLYATSVELMEPNKLAIVQDPELVQPAQVSADPLEYTGPGYTIPMIFHAEKVQDLFYEGAMRYRVVYRPLPYEVLTDEEAAATPWGELSRFVERTFTYSVQAQPIPSTIQYVFTEGPTGPPLKILGEAVPGTPQAILPMKQCLFRWVGVPDVPHYFIDQCVGKVNKTAFDGAQGWPAYPPETLLCHAPTVKWYRTIRGKIVFDITYRMDYRPKGWNRFLSADGNYYKIALKNDTSKTLYDSAEFNDLFTIPLRVSGA